MKSNEANTKQNYFNRARLSFLGIGNEATFSLSFSLYIFLVLQ